MPGIEKEFVLIQNTLLDMNFISMKTLHSMTRNSGQQWQHGTLFYYLRLQMNSVTNKETIFDLQLYDP